MKIYSIILQFFPDDLRTDRKGNNNNDIGLL
jgi:hypothetical protein